MSRLEARRDTARRVRAAMRLAGIDQRTLARRLGVAKSTLSLRLAGRVAFTVDDLVSLGRVLDVDPATLLPSAPATPVGRR